MYSQTDDFLLDRPLVAHAQPAFSLFQTMLTASKELPPLNIQFTVIKHCSVVLFFSLSDAKTAPMNIISINGDPLFLSNPSL